MRHGTLHLQWTKVFRFRQRVWLRGVDNIARVIVKVYAKGPKEGVVTIAVMKCHTTLLQIVGFAALAACYIYSC
jgi:hypothetical protein